MAIYFIKTYLGIIEFNELRYRKVGGSERPDYSKDCNLIPSNAVYIKLIMGSVVDYYKPIPGKSFCEMLQSYNLHQWSSDGKNWVTPKHYHTHLGGSLANYPTDGRKYLSFWGGHKGGCCYYEYNGPSAWNRAFTILYA